jgi:Ca2+-transporting ATPase
MVLTDDSFSTIVAAVEEGRTVYANITKFVYYLLSTNVSEVLFILLAIIMGLQSPLVTIQILWLNLCTDGFPAIALAVEATEPGVMRQRPRPRTEPIINRLQATGIAVQTVALTAVALGTYVFGLDLANGFVFPGDQPAHLSDEAAQQGVREAQTMTIYVIVFAELLRAYGSRSMRQSLLDIGPFTNKYMQYACGASALLTLAVGHVPGLRDVFSMEILGGEAWAWVLSFSFVPLLVDEATKYVYRRTGYGA